MGPMSSRGKRIIGRKPGILGLVKLDNALLTCDLGDFNQITAKRLETGVLRLCHQHPLKHVDVIKKKLQREPLLPYRAPECPLQVVETDLLEVNQNDYLFVLDAYSS